MPIAPQKFDRVFSELGIDLRMSGKCSWETQHIGDFMECGKVGRSFRNGVGRIGDRIHEVAMGSFIHLTETAGGWFSLWCSCDAL